MLLPRIWRRLSAPGIAALALSLCLSSPATGETPAASSAASHRQEREERREARSQEREERRQARGQQRRARRRARADAGCAVELQAPRIARAGAPLALTGTLSCGEAEGAGEQTVTLYRKLARTPAFTALATAGTEADGAFRFAPSELEGNSIFYAAVGATRSARVRVQAALAITLSAPAPGTPPLAAGATSAATPAAGAATFTGTVSPAGASTTVALQWELGDDRWQDIAFGHVEEDGDYSIVHGFSRRGRLTLRVLARSHGRFMTSASEPIVYSTSRRHGEPARSGQVTILTPAPSPTSAKAGEELAFTGTVAPAHEGQTVDLERESLSGLHGYHVIASGAVSASSSYSIAYAFAAVGDALLRISVPGDAEIEGAASEPFQLEITPAS